MLTQAINHPEPSREPLTHRACLAASNGRCGTRRPATWVQVRRYDREGPYVLCGRVTELGAGDAEWFKVDTCAGCVWADGKNVRMCSGDGRCTCEAEEREEAPC